MVLLNQAVPYESMGVIGLLCVAVGALWLLNGKLAKKIEDLQQGRVVASEKEAERDRERVAEMTRVVSENTTAHKATAQAMAKLTSAFESNGRILERTLDRLAAKEDK